MPPTDEIRVAASAARALKGERPAYQPDRKAFRTVSVFDGDRHINEVTAGEWFGEIGVIRRMPRTAAVRATTDATAWVIDGQTFRGALAGPLQGQGLLHGTMSTRLARTHPDLVNS